MLAYEVATEDVIEESMEKVTANLLSLNDSKILLIVVATAQMRIILQSKSIDG
jgi:hypothetical protein